MTGLHLSAKRLLMATAFAGLMSLFLPVTAANAVTLALSLSILVLKLRFDRNAIKEVTEP